MSELKGEFDSQTKMTTSFLRINGDMETISETLERVNKAFDILEEESTHCLEAAATAALHSSSIVVPEGITSIITKFVKNIYKIPLTISNWVFSLKESTDT